MLEVMCLRFWKFFKNVIDTVITVITLSSFFFNITQIKQLLPASVIEIWNSIEYRNWIIVSIFLIFFLLHGLSYIQTRNKSLAVCKNNHVFFHELRNKSFKTKSFKSENVDLYRDFVKETSEKLCTSISDYFYEKYNKNFNICIKVINISSSTVSTSINEMKVTTLCRGGKDKTEREEQETQKEVRVTEDTSYLKILSNEKDCRKNDFVCRNLLTYCLMKKVSGKPYLPELKTFWKKYLSTVVVPIRINTNYLPKEDNYSYSTTNSYQVYGFLCLDYKWPITKTLAKQLCDEMKSFADSLYIIYDEVMKTEKELKKKKKNNYEFASTYVTRQQYR